MLRECWCPEGKLETMARRSTGPGGTWPPKSLGKQSARRAAPQRFSAALFPTGIASDDRGTEARSAGTSVQISEFDGGWEATCLMWLHRETDSENKIKQT